MISFEGVGLTVPVWDADGRRSARTLLSDVDLRLAEQRIAVIGANGSGKSTLLRLVNGLASPSSGRVVVDGVDVDADPRRARSLVGFVFTDALSQLVAPTPIDDIALSLRRRHRDRKARRAAALEVLSSRGLDHLADQSIHDLSGGERQQVALAGVLAVEPVIVVADEPTTLLDLRARNRVQAELLGLRQQLLYATHDLEFAARADRALVVDGGRIVFDGVPAEAIERYRALMA